MVELERCAHAPLPRPDKGERQSFLDQLVETLNATLGFTLADKPSQAAG